MSYRELASKLGALYVHRTEMEKPHFQKIVVLDFEATCWGPGERLRPNEIIEFSAALLDVFGDTIIDKTQIYVQPTENPILSDFCTQLTGIHQNTVNNAVQLESALNIFDIWTQKHDLNFFNGTCTFATWSNWDLGTCLLEECERKGIKRQAYFNTWMDVRKLFTKFYRVPPNGLRGALDHCRLTFRGRPHSGVDDAINTAILLSRMHKDGAELKNTITI